MFRKPRYRSLTIIFFIQVRHWSLYFITHSEETTTGPCPSLPCLQETATGPYLSLPGSEKSATGPYASPSCLETPATGPYPLSFYTSPPLVLYFISLQVQKKPPLVPILLYHA